MLYNYYPGCTLSTKAKALDQAARACAAKLGFPLVELPEWQCCGAVYPLAPDAIDPPVLAFPEIAVMHEHCVISADDCTIEQRLARRHAA